MPQKLTRAEWEAKARALDLRTQAFIDGAYVDAASGKTFDCVSPIDGLSRGRVAECEAEDVERAVRAARRAFESCAWSESSPVHRKKTLQKFALLIEKHAEELALLESIDMGKPVGDALAIDVAASVRCLNWTAEAIDKVYGEIAPTPQHELGLITREPLGVVGAIVPWNFPLLMAAWKFAPALATGNSVILKPSEKSPLSAIRIAELAMEAGFAAAPDLQAAAEAAAIGIFFNQGEVCTAASRLLVERSIKDEFVAMVVEAGKHLHPKHPFEPGAPMGAIVDEGQMNRVLDYIEKGKAEGARLALGGERVMTETGGYYVAPTVFDGVAHEMTISKEEIFGPVLSVIAFDDEKDAIRIANDTDYGLAAGGWTANLSRAHRVAKKLRAGSVWVNYWDGGDMTAPFGGFKQSGNGRDKSLHAFEKYTELKATWINLR